MLGSNDPVQIEYAALMSRSRSLERTGQANWVIATLAAISLMGWGIHEGSPGILMSVVFAVAAGYLPLMHTRQQMKLIAGYVGEHVENRAGGAQWFTKLGQVYALSSAGPSADWIVTATSNLIALAAIVSAWVFKASAHGELYAAIATACGVAFGMHSVTEMNRLEQTDYAALWRRAAHGSREADRPRSSTAA